MRKNLKQVVKECWKQDFEKLSNLGFTEKSFYEAVSYVFLQVSEDILNFELSDITLGNVGRFYVTEKRLRKSLFEVNNSKYLTPAQKLEYSMKIEEVQEEFNKIRKLKKREKKV